MGSNPLSFFGGNAQGRSRSVTFCPLICVGAILSHITTKFAFFFFFSFLLPPTTPLQPMAQIHNC
jgi:hypothetical protein